MVKIFSRLFCCMNIMYEYLIYMNMKYIKKRFFYSGFMHSFLSILNVGKFHEKSNILSKKWNFFRYFFFHF